MDETGKSESRRDEERRRMRLHVGRVFDEERRFLTEATFQDLSDRGVRIRMQRAVLLPDLVLLADETGGRIGQAHRVWSKDGQAGLLVIAWRDRSELVAPEEARLFGDCYAAEE